MILLTGATGFIGSAVLQHLSTCSVRVLGRSRPQYTHTDFVECSLSSNVDLSAVFNNVDVVIHAAARVHVMDDTSVDPLSAFREVNVNGTMELARQAAAAGVKRFIFISSIKVNGESTSLDSPYNHDDAPAFKDEYGQSKSEAEVALVQLAIDTEMEVVIIRPPLVYGPGVKANFKILMAAMRTGLPLPLGSIDNQRSMVALDNLIDLIVICIDHPKAANQIFLVSDDQDVSTTELLQKMAHAFGKKARLIPIPMSWIRGVASLLGKKAVADRLCGSLQVDITHTKETLGWKPPVTMEQQLAKIAASMQSSSRDV